MSDFQGTHAEFDALADRLMGRGMSALKLEDWGLICVALEEAVQARATALSRIKPERYAVGQKCTVPECVVYSRDSVSPIEAEVVEVKSDQRYVVQARGQKLDVAHGEITPTRNAALAEDGR